MSDSKRTKLKSTRSRTLIFHFDVQCSLLENFDQFFQEMRSSHRSQMKHVVRHMVGASLLLTSPDSSLDEYRVAIEKMKNRGSDGFLIGDSALHLYRFPDPYPDVLRDRRARLFPQIIIWTDHTIPEELTKFYDGRRVEITDCTQFLITRLMLASKFNSRELEKILAKFFLIYNQLVDIFEIEDGLNVNFYSA